MEQYSAKAGFTPVRTLTMLPDAPTKVTLEYGDGRVVVVDLTGPPPEHPVEGIVWGGALEDMERNGYDVNWVVETQAWITREHSDAVSAAKVCRLVDGVVVCS